jgi:hypothetical protein
MQGKIPEGNPVIILKIISRDYSENIPGKIPGEKKILKNLGMILEVIQILF